MILGKAVPILLLHDNICVYHMVSIKLPAPYLNARIGMKLFLRKKYL
jgi:hypothetical protein